MRFSSSLVLVLLISPFATSNPGTCPETLATSGATRNRNIHWTNYGETDEFTDVANWNYPYLPGYRYDDKMIVAAGDRVSISCDTSYIAAGGTRLDQRSGSRINVYTSLGVGNWYTIWNNAHLTLHPLAVFSVGNYLTATQNSHLSLLNDSSLTVKNALTMENSDLTVEGGTLDAGSLSFTSTTVDILNHPSAITTSGALMFTGSSWTVDGGDVLVEAGSLSFDSAIVDFGYYGTSSLVVTNDLTFTNSNLNGDVSVQAGSLTLDSAIIDIVFDDTGFQSWNVAGSFMATNSKINIDARSYTPVGGERIPMILFGSTTTSFGEQDIVLSGLSGLYDTRVETTATGVTLEVLQTPPPDDLVTGEVTLAVRTNTPYVSPGNLQISADATLIIDGTSYNGGPGTIVLYDTTYASNGHTRTYSIDGTFDAVKVRNFPEGLWYELKYEESQILLEIKALNDYEDYSSRGSYWIDEYTAEDLSWWGNTFSWDKVPTWLNARKNNAVTEEEIDRLARYPIIMVGISPSGFTYNEEGASDTARRVKERGTNTKILWYWNSHNAWSPYRAYNDFNWDEWARKDPVTGEWIRDGGYGEGRRYYNQSVPEMREWWIRSCVDFMKSDEGQYFDGVFIDSVAWMREAVHPDQYQMVVDLGAALANDVNTAHKLYVGNALRQHQHNGGRDKLHFMDASYMEGWRGLLGGQPTWQGLAATIQLAREALWKGRIIMINANPWECDFPCNEVTAEQQMIDGLPNNLAVFLMMAEENAYLGYARYPLITDPAWQWDTSDFELLNTNLGPPLGPPILIGTVMSRDFEYLSVQMDLEAANTTFQFLP